MDWKMARRTAWIVLLWMGMLMAPGAQADGPSEAGVIFLKLVPGARPAGMGEAFVAMADDATATWWNPGGMAFIERQELSLMYVQLLPQFHLADLYYSFLSYVHHVPEWGTLGGNIIFTNYGETQGMDEFAQPTGTFHSYDVAFTGAYGSPVNAQLGTRLTAPRHGRRFAGRQSGPSRSCRGRMYCWFP